MLSPSTQVLLLLCAPLGRRDRDADPLLTPSEFHSLADWLAQRSLSPPDLLSPSAGELLASPSLPLPADRLQRLLSRGAAFAFALEAWTSKGLWVVGVDDDAYPARLRKRLGRRAPLLLYGAGQPELLGQGGLAIVGARQADDDALAFTASVAETCAEQGIQVVSGGARGVDQASMQAALAAGGTVVGVMADNLARAAVAGSRRDAIASGRLTLVSPYDPSAPFSAGNAMGRNKHIYALAEWALVVSATRGSGGTWSGAVEALRAGLTVFVRAGDGIPDGNAALLDRGALEFPPRPWTNLRAQLGDMAAPPPAPKRARTLPLFPDD